MSGICSHWYGIQLRLHFPPLPSVIYVLYFEYNFFLFNTLKAELNPICHLLVLLGYVTFMGPCIVSIFQYISNKMQRYTVYLYLETARHVSGGTSTHHQRIQQYLQHPLFVTRLLLSAAIVEELESGLSVLWVAYATHSTLKHTSHWHICLALISVINF
jgi:hypothetical protein